jgi:predicted hotdog family 3-hydroxylacyl-ACP dehydratase
VKLGLLIGARRIDLHVEAFTVQQTLIVRGVHVWGEHELASFECAVLDGDADRVLAEGTLSVYSPRDAATLWAER